MKHTILNKMKKIVFLVIFLSLFIVESKNTLSVPFPIGIDGVVYDNDLVTRADSSVNIRLKDLNNSFIVQGKLRNDGSFSAAIKGEQGDIINIFLWDTKYNASYNISMDGVMHGYVFYMNLTKEQQEEEKKPKENSRKKPKKPKVITGTIDFSDDPADDIPYTITNRRTGENKTGKTYGFNGYSEVIEGEEGDELEIKVGNENYNEKSLTSITGAVVKQDVELKIPKWLYYLRQVDVAKLLTYLSLIALAAIPIMLLAGAVLKKK